MNATPTAKVFEQMSRRITAREAAGDAAGLWALYMAAVKGAEMAEAAYERIAAASEQAEQSKAEERVIRQFAKAERSAIYQAVRQAGGIRPSEELREEYRAIPTCYKRNEGLPGDVMAEYLATHHAEFGIECERDLIDFFTNRAASEAHRRAA